MAVFLEKEHGSIAAASNGTEHRLTREVEGVRHRLTREVEGVRHWLTREVEGVRHRLFMDTVICHHHLGYFLSLHIRKIKNLHLVNLILNVHNLTE
jgi:hypothetical protein